MQAFRLFTGIVGIALAAGEAARWWGDRRFLPLALDELAIAGALIAAAWAAPRAPAVAAAAWGLFCGLIISLLMPVLDHLIHGPPKASAPFYAVILGAMLAVGLWALSRSILLAREQPHER